MSVPQAVNLYLEEHGLDGDEVKKGNSLELIHNNLICVPNHEHDINESNIVINVINLKLLGKVNLLGGPYCEFYEKNNQNSPAYLITESTDGDDHVIHYYEF